MIVPTRISDNQADVRQSSWMARAAKFSMGPNPRPGGMWWCPRLFLGLFLGLFLAIVLGNYFWRAWKARPIADSRAWAAWMGRWMFIVSSCKKGRGARMALIGAVAMIIPPASVLADARPMDEPWLERETPGEITEETRGEIAGGLKGELTGLGKIPPKSPQEKPGNRPEKLPGKFLEKSLGPPPPKRNSGKIWGKEQETPSPRAHAAGNDTSDAVRRALDADTQKDMVACHDQALTDPRAALARADVRIAAFPNSFIPLFCRAVAVTALGRYREAAMEFDALSTLAAVDPLIRHRRAQLLLHAGQAWLLAGVYGNARRRFDDVIRAGGESADILVDRAITFAGDGLHKEAIADLTRAIAMDHGNREARILRAVSYRESEAFDRAAADLHWVLSLDSADPDALFERGWLFYVQGDEEAAIADWHHVLRLEPPTSALAMRARRNIDHVESSYHGS